MLQPSQTLARPDPFCVYSTSRTHTSVCSPFRQSLHYLNLTKDLFKSTSNRTMFVMRSHQLMQSDAFPVLVLHSPPVAADGSHLHLVLVHRLQLVILVALPHGTPHARIVRPQVCCPPEVVQCIEGHAQQLIGLPQPIPGPVIPRVQLHCAPVCLCTQHLCACTSCFMNPCWLLWAYDEHKFSILVGKAFS